MPAIQFKVQIVKKSLMFKTVNKDVWVFDVKCVSDQEAGRRLFQLPEDTPDFDVFKQMWEKEEQMKKILCLTLRL